MNAGDPSRVPPQPLYSYGFGQAAGTFVSSAADAFLSLPQDEGAQQVKVVRLPDDLKLVPERARSRALRESPILTKGRVEAGPVVRVVREPDELSEEAAAA